MTKPELCICPYCDASYHLGVQLLKREGTVHPIWTVCGICGEVSVKIVEGDRFRKPTRYDISTYLSHEDRIVLKELSDTIKLRQARTLSEKVA